MQVTTSPAERVAFWKDVKRQLTQQHVDIDRLWRLAGEVTSVGVPLGGNGTITFTTTTTTSTSTSSTTTAECPDCASEYEVTISGITNRSGSTCDEALNGTWTLFRTMGSPANCRNWKSTTVTSCCAGLSDRFDLYYDEDVGSFTLSYCSLSYPFWTSSTGMGCSVLDGSIFLTLANDNGFIGVPASISITPIA